MSACLQCARPMGFLASMLGPVCGDCCKANGFRFPLGVRLRQDPLAEADMARMVEELRSLCKRPDLYAVAPVPMAALQGLVAIWDARMTTPDDAQLQARLLALARSLGVWDTQSDLA